MDREKTLSKIKESLKSLIKLSEEVKVEEQKLGSFDLTDGTKITSPSTELEVGSEVYMLDDQGNQTPLQDGDYVLTDGRTITVKANVIEAIAEGGTEAPQEEVETPAEGEMKKEESLGDGLPEDHMADAGEEPSNDLESRIKDLESQIEDILNIIKKLGDSQVAVNEQMMSRIQNLSEEPGDKPIKHQKREYGSELNSFSDELKEYLKSRKK